MPSGIVKASTGNAQGGPSRLGDALADAFVAEGVDAVFGLMGDGNMRWMTAIARHVNVLHARHEAAAISMADAYGQLTRRVAVASITCGPGLTQIPTPLTSAVRHGTPMVVFAGDTPHRIPFHVQALDPGPLVRSTGAVHLPLTDPRLGPQLVAEAFATAATERVPVVLTVPFDWQEEEVGDSWTLMATGAGAAPILAPGGAPSDAGVRQAAAILSSAERPLLLAGRGAVDAEAREAIVACADHVGALLGTTLLAKGLFDGHPADVGVIGGLASRTGRLLAADADVVVAFGAGLNGLTTSQGRGFGDAQVIHVDVAPPRWRDGAIASSLAIVADANLAAQALRDAVTGLGPPTTGYRSADVLARIAAGDDRPQVTIEPGVVDPRSMASELQEATPSDAVMIIGGGHFWNFVVPALKGRRPDDAIYTIADFAAIGLAVPAGIGAAVARPGQRVLVVEGDGSALMNIQELETIVRHGLDVAIVVMNDAAYGAEVHKLNAMGLPPDESIFGPTDLAAIARGFGLDAVTVTDDGGTRAAIERWVQGGGPVLIDVKVSRAVVAPSYRRLYFGEDA